ncbi:hypothetical protein C2857_007595 [Epichloe festucae Fl1]|uniref:IgE-binding protein n=1 Tax=Epichloe festucae (strain Fl1) TaxID=877507 RepID=A0A7S9KMJ4_EPIFF|nr:hypothetical protein C2857_007595 [Epichloe festucae Fl1]
MKLTLAAVIPLLPLSFVEASPTYHAANTSAVAITAALPGSPVHNRPLEASGNKFWIGKPTSTYCPLNAEECPKGKDTTIWVGNELTTCGMNVVVPGGQQVYVAPDGSLSYTQAHSAFVPPGSTRDGFCLLPERPDGLRELAISSRQFFACPEAKDSGVWQIFARADDQDVRGQSAAQGQSTAHCLKFTALASPAKDPVWQYA